MGNKHNGRFFKCVLTAFAVVVPVLISTSYAGQAPDFEKKEKGIQVLEASQKENDDALEKMNNAQKLMNNKFKKNMKWFEAAHPEVIDAKFKKFIKGFEDFQDKVVVALKNLGNEQKKLHSAIIKGVKKEIEQEKSYYDALSDNSGSLGSDSSDNDDDDTSSDE